MTFKFENLTIPEVILIYPQIHKDDRGYFLESYKKSEFTKIIPDEFVQDNQALSNEGIIRGLHYQLNPQSQGKLISVMQGSIFDVAVDIRKNSPYYGKYVAIELSATNKHMLWIPPGFAHGYLTLEDNSKVHYKTTKEFSKENERGIIWNDASINIQWPICNPLVSEKDSKLPTLQNAKNNFTYR